MIEIIISGIIAFLVTLIVMPKMITFLNNIGMAGYDQQKKGHPKVAEMGGLIVLIGFLAGILIYISFITFSAYSSLIYTFAATLTIIIITLIGMLDDLTARLKRSFYRERAKSLKRIGLKQIHKFLLPLPAALPLIAVNSGVSTINLPIIHTVDIGFFYPFFLIPLAIFGAANATNMLAGLNGLEAGMGITILTSLGIYAYIHNSMAAAAIAFIFVAGLLAFLIYNWSPAKIFPGDSLTYTIGAVAATVAIIGNIEKFAVFCFIPWFVEFALKSRNWFKAESFGKLQEDGTLRSPYEKTYSLTHVVMKSGRFKEWQISSILIITEIIICLVAFWLFL